MPIRSVIDIDVSDDKIRAIVDLMGKYQAAAARMPGSWASIGKSQATAKDILTDIRNLMLVQIGYLDRQNTAMERNRRTIDSTRVSMTGLARSTREFAGNLMSATSTLLKWTGVGGVVGSLAGLLSVQGISRLAGYGANQFRTAAGFSGTSAAQVGAAGAYSGILDPKAILGQLTGLLTTAAGKTGLVGLGISPAFSGGAGALLPDFLKRLQTLSKNTPESILGDVLQARGLGGFTDTAMVLRNMRPGQLEELTGEYVKNLNELNKIHQNTLFQWAKLSGTLDVAETRIKSAFIEALAPLTPQFERISKVVTKMILDIGTSEQVKTWMTELATALKGVKMEDFAESVKKGATDAFEFARNVNAAIKAVAALVNWIADKVGSPEKFGIVAGAATGAAMGGMVGGPVGAVVGGVTGAVVGGTAGAASRAPGTAAEKKAAGWGEALRTWNREHGLGRDRRSFSQMQADFEKNWVVAEAAIPPPGGASASPWTNGTAQNPIGAGVNAQYNKRMQEMLAAAQAAGFTGDAARTITAIAMAESSGNSMTHNTKGRDDSYGITQINARAHGPIAAEALGNDKRAMELAFKISKGGTDFSPWSTYNDKKYQQFMGGGGAAGTGTGPAAFITHHTGGRGTVQGVMSTLHQRGLGVQYVMDREGNIFRTGGPGSKHMMQGWGPVGTGLSNANTVGMEIIAKNDPDVTEQQLEAFAKFMQQNYPNTPIFGHGEVNPGHKEATEGLSAKLAALAYRKAHAQAPLAAPQQDVNVTKPPGINVVVSNATGGSGVASSAQVAQ